MIRQALAIATLSLLTLGISAQEIAIPDKPVVTTVTSYRIVGFAWEREPDWRFTITYKDSTGHVETDNHVGRATTTDPVTGQPVVNTEGAETFLRQINTLNFSTTSMTKRLLQHLVSHGKIPVSTVSGEVEK